MAGVRVVRQPDLNFAKRINPIVQQVMDEVVREAADLMKTFIGTRGTGRTWSRPGPSGRSGSYPGRVDSGEMQNAVNFDVSVGGDLIVGKFGWTKQREPYFLLQDQGFYHVLAMRDVPGMEALLDAGVWAEGELKRRLTAAMGAL